MIYHQRALIHTKGGFRVTERSDRAVTTCFPPWPQVELLRRVCTCLSTRSGGNLSYAGMYFIQYVIRIQSPSTNTQRFPRTWNLGGAEEEPGEEGKQARNDACQGLRNLSVGQRLEKGKPMQATHPRQESVNQQEQPTTETKGTRALQKPQRIQMLRRIYHTASRATG